MKRWNKGSELSVRVCVCVFLPSYIPHVSVHFEKMSTVKRSVDDLELFTMISAEEVPGSFDFCYHRGVDFAT